ncbi:MAG: restriction endonuclease subunit S [Thermodesulfobacteriota bacterium]|nr:restriction endonuclease subunit S [Thermodesulfobacteriota bacterium]
MSRQSYPKYRQSGVQWLGKVPDHWEMLRLKTIATLGYGDSLAADDRLPGTCPVYGSNGVVGEHDRANTKAPCLIVGRKGSFGKVAYSNIPCFAIDTTYFIDDRFTSNDLRWLYYSLQWLRLDSFSKDSAVPGLSREDAYNNVLPFCPIEEQRAIAAFLDRETGRIDALVEKKQRQIELLQEKRSALISHTVTKGLDPNAPTKDSGIEWLGEIPEHWPVVRLRFRARINPSRAEVNGLPVDTQVSFVPMEAVCEYGGLRLEQMKPLGDVSTGYTYFCEGDVVVAKITPCFENGKGSIGEGLENGLGFGTTELHVLRPLEDLDRRFLFYVTISHTFRKIGEAYMYGAGGQKRVPDDFIRDFRHPIPAIDIQRSIAAFLDRETVRIDAMTKKIQDSIDMLREYRTALISAAVTGKIDVRKEVS